MMSFQSFTVLSGTLLGFIFSSGVALASSVKDPAQVAPAPKVSFIEPMQGAKVAPKFKVKMAVEGYKVVPAGDLTKNTGHHHLLVGPGPIPQGQVIPTDAKHIHFGKGQTETDLELPVGKHKLTLQFADGAHRSYGPALSATIDVEVVATKK